MSQNDQLIEAATALQPQLIERADEIEAARRIPTDVARSMARAGFFRMGAPGIVGGLETPPPVSSRVFEILGRGDASAAWVAFIGMTSFTNLAALPVEVGQKVLADPDTLVTGVFAPTARAERADGGFRVSGRWQWGSGSQNAAWIMGGTMLTEGGEPMLDARGNPRSNMVLMPADEIEFLDTWHVSGLRGSGSLDFAAHDVFVPDDHVVDWTDRDRVIRTKLHSFPQFCLLALGIGAVCLGVARAAIDDLVSLAVEKKRVGSRTTISEQQLSKVTLAEAEVDLRSARSYYYEVVDDAWARVEAGDRVSLEQRRDLRLATNNAVRKSVAVVDAMYGLAGGSAVYQTSRLQRQFRDIHVAKTHIMVSNSIMETVGGLFFGLDTNVSRL